ncbi:unnamed protein product [Psylliodes chrysocephalus]|uniref:Uncharacterized protein n=1 Tax=Psylliodes chrysocephalus TaxID=3402493 RepID=A0A9P0G707_9CUCU|nr:unnamed protein product [Psylliodes chrysocephala]
MDTQGGESDTDDSGSFNMTVGEIALALDSDNSRKGGTVKVEDSNRLAGGGSVKTDEGSQIKETGKKQRLSLLIDRNKSSGAERKKLLKERKMAAGTWTEENLHKNAAQKRTQRKENQPKKGDKRPRSKSQTPPTRSRTKRARNAPASAGSYSDTLRGIRLTVIQRRHPDTTLDQAQEDLVQETLMERLYAAASGSGGAPQFHRTSFSAEVIWISYANQ